CSDMHQIRRHLLSSRSPEVCINQYYQVSIFFDTVRLGDEMDMRHVKLSELIDRQPFGRFLCTVVGLGFAAIILDGFDISVMGLIAPQLRTQWNLSHDTLGFALSAALIGQTIGAVCGGTLSDIFGRRPVIIASVLSFGICTLGTAIATSVSFLIVTRFLSGLGLGAIIPSTTTLIAEFAPKRMKALLVTLTLCGFTVGGVGGGVLVAYLLPVYGWRSILVIGGVMPLVLVFVMLPFLPETLNFLLVKKRSRSDIEKITNKIDPDFDFGRFDLRMDETSENPKSSLKSIFSGPYMKGTIFLCLADFFVLFLIYLFNSWLPTLIKEGGGYSLKQSALAMSVFQLGGPLGSLVIGWLMDRYRPNAVLALNFIVSALAVAGIGQSASHYGVVCGLAFVAGATLVGGSVGLAAFAAEFYPTETRATGISIMLGLGRFGAILSALAGAAMLTLRWDLSQIFLALLFPGIAASLVIWGTRPPPRPVEEPPQSPNANAAQTISSS
ncbi:MFS transporter, partial [Paraburkholderia domus]|uniref:MFS transporter n=1 Tax=Paraburkholderia domus TaxID=2793075 RepID=UPI001BAA8C9B